MISSLTIRNHYTSDLTRCINEIVVLLPLNKPCKINLNGSIITIENGIIINNADLFQMLNVQDVVELKLPLPLFYEKDSNLSNSYFDFNRIHFVEQFRNLVLKDIHHSIEDENAINTYISNIVEFLIREAKVLIPTQYIPPLYTKHPLVQKITNYIHENIHNRINTKQVAQTFFISQSYISILFSKVLNMNFKYYTTSLRIALSLFDLIQEHKSIYDVAMKYQFTNVSTYSKHFKNYIHIPPKKYVHDFRDSCYNVPNQMSIDHVQIVNYFNTTYKATKSVSNDRHTINLSTLSFDTVFESGYTFIKLNDLNDLLFFSENHIKNTTLSSFPKVNLNILNTNFNHLNALKSQQVLSVIQYLMTNGYYLTFKITDLTLSQTIAMPIKNLLTEINSHLDRVTLQFDFTYQLFNDFPMMITSLKHNYPMLKIGITIDNILKNSNDIVQIIKLIKSLNVDFYYIDLDLHTFNNLISHKLTKSIQQSNLKQNIALFCEHLGSIYAKKLIFTHITHTALKEYFNSPSQDTHVLLTQFLIETNTLIGGVGYNYYSDDPNYIMLVNQYHCYMPIVHIYSFLDAFYDQNITLLPNVIIAKTNTQYHLILFNNQTMSSLVFRIHHNFIKSFPIFSRLLNSEHGMITKLVPSNLEHNYIGISMISAINHSNFPLSKLQMHYFKDPLQFKINSHSILYVMISIN
ncbi:helix-turn-helix domain-containing protein [Staphylococcus caeli]|uniref:helix-turn-helix domain-containing protein n=1 Tax=Staphylococcus caeli TaxID=2201815 RepID=UPI003F56CB85